MQGPSVFPELQRFQQNRDLFPGASRRILRLQRHGMSQLGSRSEPERWNAKANFNEASRIMNICSCKRA